jgi:hypothetical protein
MMKRDLDLVREILLACEAEEHGFAPIQFDKLMEKGYAEELIGFHCLLIGDAGLAVIEDLTNSGDESPNAAILYLTWAGYEFLEAARDDARWFKAKSIIATAKAATFEVAKNVLTQLALQAAKAVT